MYVMLKPGWPIRSLCFTRFFHAAKVRTVRVRAKHKIRLATAADTAGKMKPDWEQLKKLALAEVAATLAELPAPLRERAVRLPVSLERMPHADFVAEGIEADSLGLFTGPAFGEEDLSSSPVPPQIFLFLENLWDFAEADEEIYLEEVHTTYLHELGHYLGLDEDDLTERGLD